MRGRDGNGTPSTHSGYIFENSGREAGARFAALSTIFDPGTIRHLETCGIRRGWHCLEVGAGSGSITRWLVDRVGRTGSVLATDIDPCFLECLTRPNLDVRRHDIAADALPEAAFDLVHARLVLMHLPQREIALARMISALKRGGWLVVEDYDSASMPPDPSVSPGEVRSETHVAMMRFFEDRGMSRRYGRLLFGQLRAHGLISLGAEGRVFMWQRGSPGASLMRANYEHVRQALIEGDYVARQQLEEDLERLDDPGYMIPSPILWSAWGRRP
jgi:SAM-dependent methyltransferase